MSSAFERILHRVGQQFVHDDSERLQLLGIKEKIIEILCNADHGAIGEICYDLIDQRG
jgi:hypothetical protein